VDSDSSPAGSGAVEGLAAAVHAFNRGDYLEAHELLEELWEADEGAGANFYKGLIQAAVCLHHFADGNAEGARKLYAGHRRYLGQFLPTHANLDVAGALAEMSRCLAPLLAASSGEGPSFDRGARPVLRFCE